MSLLDTTSTVGGTASSALNFAKFLPGIGIGAGILGGFLGQRKLPSAKDLNRMFGVGALAGDTQKLYQLLANSPQFRATLAGNAATGSRFTNQLAGNLAARGLSTSGIGSVARAAGSQAISTGETALRGGLFGTAQQGAMQNLLARLQAFTEMQGLGMQRPSFMESLSGSLLSAGGRSLV